MLGDIFNEIDNRRMVNRIYEGIEAYGVGEENPRRPGYFLWPDGEERMEPVPPHLIPRPTVLDRLIDWAARV